MAILCNYRAFAPIGDLMQRGFTLIEMIVTLVILSIVISVAANLISKPWQMYEQGSARAQIVGQMNRFLDVFEQDIQNAIPNSVRTQSGVSTETLEFFPTLAKGRYRDSGTRGLIPAQSTISIDVFEQFAETTARLVVNNTSNGSDLPGQLYYDATNATAAAGQGVITASDLTVTIGVCATCIDTDYVSEISLSDPWQFALQDCAPACLESSPLGSASRRIYLTDGAAIYQCRGGSIYRHTSYTLESDMSNYASIADGDSAVILTGVSRCEFDYLAGTSARGALVDITIEVTDDNAGTVALQRQIQVVNAP